jgi:uncharacterized protein CbrC (UPF0167 family)
MAKARFSDLPTFKYHANPFSTGALEDSDDACECCGLARGYMYRGPVFCKNRIEHVCPWCISDGSAARKWGAQFTDAQFCDRHFDVLDMPSEVVEEVLRRTPGVVGALQSVHWWVHCQDAAEFVGVEDDRVRFRCLTCGKRWSYQDLD